MFSLKPALFACALAAAEGRTVSNLRHTRGFVKPLDFEHKLRVCNGYPSESTLSIIRGKDEAVTEEPMPYKACNDFMTRLAAGDKLAFKVGDTSAGTFSISELPRSDSVLLLVVHRHDPNSTSMAFESHVFANLNNAQVAIIDTYKGKAHSTARIMDEDQDAGARPVAGAATGLLAMPQHRSESLRYNSVVAVNPGKYEVLLSSDDGEMKAKSPLVALSRQSYVVFRTGVEATQEAQAFPEELVVFPQSNPNDPSLAKPTAAPRAHSAASARAGGLAGLALAVLMAFTSQ